MRIVEVYSAANYPEAGAIQALLDEHGIESELRGGDLNPLAGEIPFGEAQPGLWVVESDYEKARAIIEQRNIQDPDGEIPDREQQSQSFTAAQATPARTSAASATHSGDSHWLWKAGTILFFCTTLLLGYMSNRNRIVEETTDGWETLFEYGKFDEKSGCDIERWIENDLITAKYCDNNGDGVPDSISFYGAREKLTAIIHDSDFNGKFERTDEYDRNGNLRIRFDDRDQDGFSEMKTEFLNNVESIYVDQNDNRIFERNEIIK